MRLDTSAVGGLNMGSTSLYGHADYYRDKANGVLIADLLANGLMPAPVKQMGNGGSRWRCSIT